MFIETLKQIEKELKYAEIKHPYQILTREDTTILAASKLNAALTGGNLICCFGNNCINCKDTNKWLCGAFAAIAILVRGIEKELEKNGDEILSQRNKLLDNIIKNNFKFYEKVDLDKLEG